jgi:co-chaperonin GroES (HSP10)
MVVRGKRILVSIPKIKEAPIKLSEKEEQERQNEAIKQWTQLEVFAAGTEITDIKAGDKVYIQTYALESGERIDVEGEIKLLIPESAVAIIF